MTEQPTSDDAAVAARSILTAIESADLETLESCLRVAERTEPASERHELLAAIAGRLRRGIRRFRRRVTPRVEGMEVHLRLLRHLARA